MDYVDGVTHEGCWDTMNEVEQDGAASNTLDRLGSALRGPPGKSVAAKVSCTHRTEKGSPSCRGAGAASIAYGVDPSMALAGTKRARGRQLGYQRGVKRCGFQNGVSSSFPDIGGLAR